MATLLTACTSSLVIGTAYNRLPNSLSKRLQQYADFNPSQERTIRTRARQYHRWHRETQLPQYSAFLRTVSLSLDTTVNATIVDSWIQSIDTYRRNVTGCNPLNDTSEFLSGLTDQQVAAIANTLSKRHLEKQQEYNNQTAQQRISERYRKVLKNADRLGLPFNRQQERLLRQTLARQTSMGNQRRQLWQGWNGNLLALLKQRDTEDFASRIDEHMASLWSLTATAYPDEWQTNIRLWRDFLLDFMQLQSKDERQNLQRYLRSLATTIDRLAAKESRGLPAQCFSSSVIADKS